MEENIKLIDLVIEIIDARAPLSTRNPDIDTLSVGKFRMILLNKSDMSDKNDNIKWCNYFESKGIKCIEVNSKTGLGIKGIDKTIKEVCKEKIERDRKRGILNRPIRCMIVGIPNVGKSTLMNALVGERLSIITSKAQTTRHRIMGIVNGDDFQIVYTDTPGIVNPHYKLHEQMMGFVNSALEDADLFILVTEIGETFKNQEVLAKIIRSETPVILVINKIDLSDQQTINDKIAYWRNQIPRAIIIPASATEHFNIDNIFDNILDLLPENPPYFPKDELTDRSMRFFVSEIIREKLLLFYQKEIPYSCEVAVESYEEKEGVDNIRAVIFVERESQKAILIGHQGKSIKKVGIEARKDIEEFTGKRCFLNLYIKVLKDWRNSDRALKQFGYESE